MFGLAFAKIINWSDTEIVAEVPYSFYGYGTVEVTAGPFPTSNKLLFTYNGPIINAIYPLFGNPGLQVKIEGRDFGFKGISPSFYVKFGCSLANIISWNDTEIIAEVPSDYGTGTNGQKNGQLAFKIRHLRIRRIIGKTPSIN